MCVRISFRVYFFVWTAFNGNFYGPDSVKFKHVGLLDMQKKKKKKKLVTEYVSA